MQTYFSPGQVALPKTMQSLLTRKWQAYLDACAEHDVTPVSHVDLLPRLQHAFACSDMLAKACIATPGMLTELVASGDMLVDYTPLELMRRLAAQTAELSNEQDLMQVLRAFRRREYVRIAIRDLAGMSDLFITMRELSWLAEACVECALGVLSRLHKKQFGTPKNKKGQEQKLLVIGMGKLGAHELNFSSDIDLIYAYGEEGSTRGGRLKFDNSEYFTRLGQRLMFVLDHNTADGFVFRVDLRLRPFGDSGPLAMSLEMLEDYYQTHGREWERYAMVKARVLAGDRALGSEVMRMLRPFVYRRYLDYGSFESLREMKQLIVRQVASKGMKDNIKLGAGGIREIEFIGQAFQLIRGGRDKALQARPICAVLDLLAAKELLPAYVVNELKTAYVFLRDCEHRLQMRNDEQTHTLPVDEQEREIIATAMGFADWQQFSEQLAQQRETVHNHFEQVFAAPQSDDAGEYNDFESLWQGVQDDDLAGQQLQRAGFTRPDEALQRILQLRDSHACRALSSNGRKRMDRLMPLLIAAIAAMPNADETLGRILYLVEGIAQRTAYIALLVENPMALSQLVKLCAASPWISELLARHPLLLDELLDARTLYSPLSRQELQAELGDTLARIDGDDLEAQMDALRHFKQTQVLRVAAADVNADMPLMKVSDHLTDIAEVILEQVLALVWQYMLDRHGRPPCLLEGDACDSGFAVIAYGKLGGIELGYGSDLDLVFLYAGDDEGKTDGKRPLDLPVFYARLAQRMTHLFSTQTHAGILYEVDLRLRPDGAAGLLVSSVQAYADYQQKSAWTWEHQALVRARFVAGDPLLAGKFAAIRDATLARPRKPATLRAEVRDMRSKMRDELGSHKAGEFDLKQDAGGIADIEFLVQYGVLRWASEHPELLRWTDNIRIIAVLAACGCIDGADGQRLSDIYRGYRSEVHRLTLLGQPARIAGERYVHERDTVVRVWRTMLEDD